MQPLQIEQGINWEATGSQPCYWDAESLKSATTLILMGQLLQYPERLRQQGLRCTLLYSEFERANSIANNGILYILGQVGRSKANVDGSIPESPAHQGRQSCD